MLVWEIGLIFIALGICIAAFGYNLKLAGYSRKKMLEGVSASLQMNQRRKMGDEIMRLGLMAIAVMAVIFFVVSMLIGVETKEIIPEKVDITMAQGKTIIITDGQVHVLNKVHHHIKRVYFVEKINSFGLGIHQDIVIEYKDQWER